MLYLNSLNNLLIRIKIHTLFFENFEIAHKNANFKLACSIPLNLLHTFQLKNLWYGGKSGGKKITVNPNLPAPVNFVPFGTMTYSPFDINLMSMTCIKFIYLYFCLFLNKAYTFLFAMIYALTRYIIFLTFINVIDSRLTRNILKMGRVN